MAITQTHATHETVSTDAQLDDRDIRALLTPMTVIDNCGDVAGINGLFEVTTDSGSCYTVSLRGDGECTCPDHKYRDVRCKHIRRCEFEIGVRAIPGHVNLDTLDDQLGMHVTEGEPRIAMADGGVALEDAAPASESADALAAKVGFVVGVDALGDAHVHYPASGVVRVFDVPDDYEVGDYLGDDVVRTQGLEGRPLVHWMRYVADKRGWATVTHRAPDEFDAAQEVSA